MKKNYLYIPVLLLAIAGSSLAFTSCVDNKESSSVTDVRNARAAQLNAEAALATSQAAAATVQANAAATLAAAQAAQSTAQANLIDAQAAQVAAKTTSDSTLANIAVEQAQAALAVIQAQSKIDLAKAQSDLDKVTLQSQIDMIALQNELDKLKTDDPVLTDALAKYSNFMNQVNTLKGEIASASMQLSTSKALLSDAEKSVDNNTQNTITMYQRWINNDSLQIVNNNVSIANYQSLLANSTSTQDAINQLTAQRDSLIYNVSPKLLKAKDDASSDVQKALDAVNSFRQVTAPARYWSWSNVKQYYQSYTYSLQQVDYYTVSELQVIVLSYTAQMNSVQTNLTTDSITYQNASDSLATNYTAYTNAQSAEQAALDNRNAVYADTAATAAQQNAADSVYAVAQANTTTSYNSYTTCQNTLNNLQQVIVNERTTIVYYQDYMAGINISIQLYNGNDNYPRTLEETYYAAMDKQNLALNAWYSETQEITNLNNMISNLYIKYSTAQGSTSSVSPDDVNLWIVDLNDSNVRLQNYIDNYNRSITAAIANGVTNKTQLEQDIVDLQAQIDTYNTELSVAQKQAADAKAVIDAKTN